MARKLVLVALGGNAIKQADEKGTFEEQFNNIYKTCEELVKLIKAGYRLVITHGNGPQAGSLLIQQEAGASEVPPMPLDAIGAMTQGQIGYMFAQALENILWREKIPMPIVSVVNQVVVDPNDPDFKDPSKPVGPFYTKEESEKLKAERKDWIIKQVKPENVERRFRRVVASPKPVRNVEYLAIRQMVENDMIVITSGGGGIPVISDKNANLTGIAAVIDKDRAGEKLAESLGTDIFLILTDVENALINYGKENQQPVGKITVSEMQKYVDEGHFLAGSMGPKVEAAIEFVKFSGCKSIITSLDKAKDAITGNVGTQIFPDHPDY